MSKIIVKFNGYERPVTEGVSILEASVESRVDVPSLYYRKGLVNEDTSGVCVVEADGELVNASSTVVKPGMEINTETPAVMAARREAVARILAVHRFECTDCPRIDSCELKTVVHECGMGDAPYMKSEPMIAENPTTVLVRDDSKCIRCGRCVQVCGRIQGIGALRTEGEGLEAHIVPMSDPFSAGVGLGSVNCVNCGQCAAVCPTGALTEVECIGEVQKALADPEKFVIVQVAPSVRAALGEAFGFPVGVDVEGRIAAALRSLGFDRVFDTKFGADLTIMEESNELIERIQHGGKLPMLTSCCPGWVKYAEHLWPDFLGNISSCKSPQQMFGAVCKSYYAEKLGIDKERMVVVSVMPCVAKKFELTRPDQDGAGVPDVDYSITTRELARMIKAAGIEFESLPFENFDDPLGLGTGAGVIFGATGGVMEAALRTAVEKLTGKPLESLEFTAVRGMEGVKEAAYEVNGKTVRVAVASGLANAGKLLESIKTGTVDYDFVEIMACPGGCINGGGQPHQGVRTRLEGNVPAQRAAALYRNDAAATLRKSHENPAIREVYGNYLGEPGSEKAHRLLHTSYVKR